jgi:hypothetical protein
VSWNYRVIEFVDPTTEELWRAIHEVHYHADGRPSMYSENPASVTSCDDAGNQGDLAWVLDRMRDALGKPALKETDFQDPT